MNSDFNVSSNSNSTVDTHSGDNVIPSIELSFEICNQHRYLSNLNGSTMSPGFKEIMDKLCDDYMVYIGGRFISYMNSLYWVKSTFVAPVSIIFGMFGVVTNIINAVVFYRQGIMSDSATPIFVGLAISDCWFCLLRIIWYFLETLKGNLVVVVLDPKALENYEKLNIIKRMFGLPIKVLTQFTCWVTVYLAFERMISVTFPFQARSLLRPKRSCAILLIIFFSTFALKLPVLLEYKLTWVEMDNGTSVMEMVPYGVFTNNILFWFLRVNELYLRFSSIGLVVLFNIVIMVRVNLLKAFHTSNTSKFTSRGNKPGAAKESNASSKQVASSKLSKEARLTRMISILSAMFVICYTPEIFHKMMVTLGIIRYYSAYQFHLFAETSFVIFPFLEFVNSCLNFVIYYSMSSKFKAELQTLFSRRKTS